MWMKRFAGPSLAACAALLIASLAGCGPETVIQISYTKQALYEISPEVKRLGISEFGAASQEEKRWGEIASDRLAAALDDYNRKYHRYELVDRRRLKAILDEQDLQMAVSDSASAGKVGKIAHTDAMVYGNVAVTAKDEQLTRTTISPLNRSTKPVTYTRRYCLVAVNFTMDDVQTAKTLASVSVTREFDSEKNQKKSAGAAMLKVMGLSGDKLPAADQVILALIDECVAEFLGKISPHEIVAKVPLEKGKSKVVETGNKLAAAGDWKEALVCYEKGMQEKPDDAGAVFNAGAMHEALGDLKQAEALYDRAFQMDPKEEYVFARKRVRVESGS